MMDGTAPHGPETVLVPLEPAIVEPRGYIQPLVEAAIRSALVIFSKQGEARSDHYHLTDWHYLYVVSGRMVYLHRLHGDPDPPQRVIVEAGQMVFSPPMVEHRVEFLEDTVCVTLSRNARDQASYEADVRRITMPVPEGPVPAGLVPERLISDGGAVR